MSPEDAAAILGVSLDSSAADIENAYRRRARATHPDLRTDASRSQHDTDEFVAVAEAHALLVSRLGITPATGAPVEFSRPRPRSRLLVVAWAGVAVFAIFVSIYGGAPSWGVGEPVLRYGLTLVTLLAFAITGRTPWLVIALLALAATAIITVVATTFGALVGLLLLVAPVYGLVTIGRDVAVRRARWAHL
ncbi:DnaJ domain-containing protein [Salinibacterium sp. G-O1]|uniref:DnaJ domain-containing protein n=1 Tax=Salinibacterium sp. G-O1 TaxID=3046208 RepID=UPI0024B8F993|nr:DnaJ domain-containing protein [Salinibacterium sp. G-O1]MDJ0334570.1 DnaJ domain-containing protein [Salinibacterium sp. G-O1]